MRIRMNSDEKEVKEVFKVKMAEIGAIFHFRTTNEAPLSGQSPSFSFRRLLPILT